MSGDLGHVVHFLLEGNHERAADHHGGSDLLRAQQRRESDLSGRLQHHRQQRLRARAALHPRRLHHARAHSHSHASRLHGVALVPCFDRRLGVCRATLGNSTCKFAVFGVSYFAITFWDAYSNMYPSNNSNADVIRLLVTSG